MTTQATPPLKAKRPIDVAATIRRILATTAALWIGTVQPQGCTA